MPPPVGDLVAGVMKGAAQGMKVVFGTEKALQETKNEIKTKPLDDVRLAAAERLHGVQ